MTDLLTRVRAAAAEVKRASAGALDGTDDSLWFVYGALLHSTADTPPAMDRLGYAVYLADLLAESADRVEVRIEAEGNRVHEVLAIRGERVQCVLSWVQRCAANPDGDHIGFRYADALRDFGQPERARALDEKLALFVRR